jgi:copper chaperone CopZ
MHCLHAIQTELRNLEGVINIVADLDKKQATIDFEPPATEKIIKDLLAEINYPVKN